MAAKSEFKSRISSIRNTAQITKAMQLVSASKMHKAQERALKAIPYSMGIYEIISKLGGIKDYSSIYLKQVPVVKTACILVVGTNRGFVGSLNTNLLTSVIDLKERLLRNNPDIEIRGISLHKSGLKILANARIKNDYHFAEYADNPTTTNLSAIFEILVNSFSEGIYDEIYVVYTHFKSTVNQEAVSKKLLPLSMSKIFDAAESSLETNEGDKQKEQSQQSTGIKPYRFEPSMNTLLDRLLPEYFQTQIFTGVLESIASEHSARMISMKNASDNAMELEKKLLLKYNRQRQAQITNEIIEVISGI